MKDRFLKPNDPLLRKTAERTDPDSPKIQQIIKTMLKVAQIEQKGKKKPIMVGLAAPQIGILKRIILVDVKADGKGKVGDLRVYVNPEVIWQSKKKGEWYEGCYSTGKICGIVSRPISIKIHAYTLKTLGVRLLLPHTRPNRATRWDIVEEKWTGYVARIFQHEIDHLNGKVFISHIKNPDHLHTVEKKEFPVYRDKEAWRNWPKKYTLH